MMLVAAGRNKHSGRQEFSGQPPVLPARAPLPQREWH